jgi:galactonate dehydratase
VYSEIEQPVAAGETFYGLEPFWRLFTARGGAPIAHVAMPDIKHCGGPGLMKRIATLAEAAHVQIAPHNPSGPVALAHSVHACAAFPNFSTLEYAFGETDWRHDLLQPAERFVDGYVEVSDAPGLGFTLNEIALTAHGGA